jgi:hypothetical protein
VREVKPIWTSSTFLVYTGGLTVLFAGIGALGYLATQYPGKGAITAWALLILVILYAIAHALRIRERPIAAGIFAFSSVIAWAVFVGVLFSWMHFTRGDFNKDADQWSWSRLLFELLILAAAWDDLRRFRFPFIKLITAVVVWVFVIDLINGGRNFTLALTLLVGIAYFLVGTARNNPSSYWLHLVGGLLVAVPILVWCHTSIFDFAVIAFMSLVYVAVAHATRRSSWAFFGATGFFIVSIHFLVGSPTGIARNAANGQPPSISVWSYPLGFRLLGFWLLLLGMLGRRLREPAAPPPADPAPA